jgi:hypothetical protein
LGSGDRREGYHYPYRKSNGAPARRVGCRDCRGQCQDRPAPSSHGQAACLIGGVRRAQASPRRQGWAYVEKAAAGAPPRSPGRPALTALPIAHLAL